MSAGTVAFIGCRLVGIVFLVQGLGSGGIFMVLDALQMKGNDPQLWEWLMLGTFAVKTLIGISLWAFAAGIAPLISGTSPVDSSRFASRFSGAAAPAIGWLIVGFSTWKFLDLFSLRGMPTTINVDAGCLLVLALIGLALNVRGKRAFVPSGRDHGL
ncbi:MAG: hypothetical protein K1X67_23605 [Fimbriimonadaceae bacterium]|nr:hypothetical protein [Fimbriimonadaceae bacterium]